LYLLFSKYLKGIISVIYIAFNIIVKVLSQIL
jgi:hypothetical protein